MIKHFPRLPAQVPARSGNLSRNIFKKIFLAQGWSFDSEFPNLPKAVAIISPHRLKYTPSMTEAESFSWQKVKNYLAYFYRTPNLAAWLAVLITFKIADGLSGPLLKPLMVDLGLSFAQIGLYVTMLGAVAALAGAGLAGFSLKFLSRAQALLVFSIFKILSLAAYTWLAFQYETQRHIETWVIYLINAAEDMISAMLLVVMLTLVMQYSRKHLAGTDFTFQVSLMATVSGGLYSLSGIFADALGYADYLLAINIIAILSVIFILRWISYITKRPSSTV
jgi:hypothetical protein